MNNKIFKMWILFMMLFSQQTYSQSTDEKIFFADSLYNARELEKSLQVYEEIFQESKKFSLSMLLKLAYLNENKGDFAKALFYLNLFYRYQPDKKILEQMEWLAEKNNLLGYKYTDLEYFTSLYNEYYYHFIIYVLCGSFSYFLYLLILKLKRKPLGYRSVAFLGLLMLVYYITNFRIIPSRAIISDNNSILMSAPSAASEVINIVGKGHRVTLYSKNDIWYEISWEDGRAFIREDNLHIFPLNYNYLF